jgi:hypothetical protein
MPGPSPTLGDIYKVSAMHILGGDAKGVNANRPVGIVREARHDLVVTLGRSTTDVRPGDLSTPPMCDIGLDKGGAFSTRFQHSLPRPIFGGPTCTYAGALPQEWAEQLVALYESS